MDEGTHVEDEDLLLHQPVGLRLLVAAADSPQRPKQQYRCTFLEDYALDIVYGCDACELRPMRAAVEDTRQAIDPLTRRWAAYVQRFPCINRQSGAWQRTYL